MNTSALIIITIIVYLGFGATLYWVSGYLRKNKQIKYVIFIPILLSFVLGLGMMLFAMTTH